MIDTTNGTSNTKGHYRVLLGQAPKRVGSNIIGGLKKLVAVALGLLKLFNVKGLNAAVAKEQFFIIDQEKNDESISISEIIMKVLNY